MVGLIDDYFKKFPICSRIKLRDDYGTVKYVGEIKGYNGLWIGIEWDDPTRGKHNGTIDGFRYFQTEYPTAGSMIRPDKLLPFETVEEAVKNRYSNISEQNPLDENLMRKTQKFLNAALFEIVGMDKLVQKQSKIGLLIDISVQNSLVNIAGNLRELSKLTSINLSSTLIWNWKTVADICEQIPTLCDMNLGCNRFVVPTDEEVTNLEPCFRSLKKINLRKCNFKHWPDVRQTAKLWPNIEVLGLHENLIESIDQIDCDEIFKNLQELDIHSNKLSNFDDIIKLGQIKTLSTLFLMENDIKSIKFSDIHYNEKLTIFTNLKSLNITNNLLNDTSELYNELDKLPALEHLCKTPDEKTGYEEMFSLAVSLISNLKTINKVLITNAERRGAEYDTWKKYAPSWIKSQSKSEDEILFFNKFRNYSQLVKKYGSPEEFTSLSSIKQSNLIRLHIRNSKTEKVWIKKVPRKISLQTLQGLIIKYFKLQNNIPKKLSHHDPNCPDLVYELDNLSKNLDFYSLVDDSVIDVIFDN